MPLFSLLLPLALLSHGPRAYSLGASPQPAVQEQERPARPKELEVLDRFIGTWDIETVARPAQGGTKEVIEKGVNVVEWTLDRSFLRTHSYDAKGNHVAIQLFTWDSTRREYRHWFFGNGGMMVEGKGSWDEADRTMTVAGKGGEGTSLHFKGRFVTDGSYETTLDVKDDSGKLLVDVQGAWTRRKGGEKPGK